MTGDLPLSGKSMRNDSVKIGVVITLLALVQACGGGSDGGGGGSDGGGGGSDGGGGGSSCGGATSPT